MKVVIKKIFIGILVVLNSCSYDNPFALEYDFRIKGSPDTIKVDFGTFENIFIYSDGLLVEIISLVNGVNRDASSISYSEKGGLFEAKIDGKLWKTKKRDGIETIFYDNQGEESSIEFQTLNNSVTISYANQSHYRLVSEDSAYYYPTYEFHKIVRKVFDDGNLISHEQNFDTLHYIEFDAAGNVTKQFYQGGDTVYKSYSYPNE